MEKSDDDDNTAEDLCTQDITTGVGMKETGSTNKTLDKRKDNKYYCNLCASGSWDKSVSLSQHMRHMHKSEYNASIEVPLTKRRWTKDEILILAEFEAKIPSSDGIFINQILAKKFPTRTLESIKSRRKTREYRELLQQLRDCRASQNIEGLECTDESSDVHSDIVENDDVINNNNNDEDYDNNNPNDIITTTVRGTDGTTYPNVQQYIKDKIIDGRVQMCTTMADALSHYVDDVLYSDPVEESLNGIREALESVHSSKKHKDEKLNAGSKLRSDKSKRKVHKFAHYQRLFKKDKSKLASEIFDGVDNSALKPPMSVAYEHFRKIWETDTKDTGTLDEIASVGTDVLLGPISREEIALAIDQTKNDTAVGPDHVSLNDVKRIARSELWSAYNIWIGSRRVPEKLKVNRTVLLPKGKDGLDNIKNWRPITIASILIRLYNKILTRRMQSVFRTSSKQTGFKPVNGVGQNVAILHNLLRHARTNKSNLFVCLLDVSKAFDSVPHESIIRALVRNGCPSEFIEIIKNEYKNSYTALSCADGDSPLVYIKRGVKQGDPMSSVLFNLVIDELFEIIGDRFGYELPGVGRVNARAFADDIALFSGSEIGMQELLSVTEEFLRARGLELNADKCVAICLRKAGKVKKSQIADSSVKNPPSFTVQNKPIRLLGINEQCRYLGVLFTPFGAVDPRATVTELRSALESLKKAPLKPQQKLLMLRSYLIPRFIFSFINTECYPKLIGQQDRLIRRWLKEILRLPKSVCSEFFYLPIKDGGLGVGKLYDIIGIAKVRLHASCTRPSDECLRFLMETQGSSMHARWCHAMKLSNRPSAIDINTRKVLSIDESRSRLLETVHGSGSEIFRKSPITNQWLSGQTRIMKGNTFIKALHMRTNTTPTLVSTSRGREVDKKCRRCGLVDETLIHILQTCPITQGMRCHRHNNVCRKVSEKLRVKGFQVFQEQGVPSPHLQTNISRPDIIAIRGDQALVLDVTCVFESHDNSFQDAYRRKVDRYKTLDETIKQLYKVDNVVFHGLCIGSRGAYDPRHLSIWHSIGFSGAELAVLAVGVIEDSLRTITFFNNANRLRI
ncbi:unnamed protein product [Rotaria magnacalcarata]|uniref:Reverse transcriptase domain-containing protein n=1 Tax=Rotaria magnacalcarata TaxID=392030 RepID=A0A8S2QJK3_9BILA|nr:unnamed protein product [Rotaria magnacalcarata]